jgi:Divergent InlB B-repeat domain
MRKCLALGVLVAGLWLAPGALAAGWCGGGDEVGTDRTDIVTAQQVHAVVAIPSDAADPFATDAGRLADDATSMLTWWQGQDPTRIPRFDLATFPGGSCLDTTFVRLPQTGAGYTALGANGAFSSIANTLAASGSRYKDYLVYYDGPSVQENVCGVGGTEAFDTGPSFAIVLLQSCPGIPTDTIATHELLHALGAVPPGDPHPCPGDSGHPCDSPTDVLYPYTSGALLSSLVLDYNHDDYYGHSGSWPDVQDSLWLHRLDVPEVALGVAFSGVGRITSDLPGVDCAATCTTEWDQGAIVTLNAEPAATDRFVHWSGSCKGAGPCALTLAAPAAATAVFGPLRIPLRLSTAGKGKIKCTPTCGKTFPGGDSLTLRAVPTKGFKFVRWSGGCKGTRPTCRPPTDFAVTVHASFKRR